MQKKIVEDGRKWRKMAGNSEPPLEGKIYVSELERLQTELTHHPMAWTSYSSLSKKKIPTKIVGPASHVRPKYKQPPGGGYPLAQSPHRCKKKSAAPIPWEPKTNHVFGLPNGKSTKSVPPED